MANRIPRGYARTFALTFVSLTSSWWVRDDTFGSVGPAVDGGHTRVGSAFGPLTARGEVITYVNSRGLFTITRFSLTRYLRSAAPLASEIYINGQAVTIDFADSTTTSQGGISIPIWDIQVTHASVGTETSRTIHVR